MKGKKKKYLLFWCNFRSHILLCSLLSIRKEKHKLCPREVQKEARGSLPCKCYCMTVKHEQLLQLSIRKCNLSVKVNVCLSITMYTGYSFLCCFSTIYWFLVSLICSHSVEKLHHLRLDADVKIKSNSALTFLLERQVQCAKNHSGNYNMLALNVGYRSQSCLYLYAFLRHTNTTLSCPGRDIFESKSFMPNDQDNRMLSNSSFVSHKFFQILRNEIIKTKTYCF